MFKINHNKSIAYTTKKDAIISEIYTKLSDIGAWKILMENNYNQSLFIKMNEEQYLSGYKIKSNNQIYVPNLDAISSRAKYYKNKYDIEIAVVSEQIDLESFINNSNESGEPKYIGVITGKCIYMDETHVTPLLFYLPGNGEVKDVECLILDSVGIDGYSHLLTLLGFDRKKIWCTTKPRQADSYSCRTGALILLRNALLSLKYYGMNRGFNEILKSGKVSEQNITSLPPEWDYTEQFTNKNLNSSHLVIRNYFSSKDYKFETSALQFREKHKRKQECEFKGWNDFTQITYPETPQDGFELICDGSYLQLKFKFEREVNTYLLEKGRKMAEKEDWKQNC